MAVETEIKQWGNSLGIVIPSEEVRHLGLKKGDHVRIPLIVKKRVDGFGLARTAPAFEHEPFEDDLE
ncbi:MAG TPA: AbrB/MazE/SpoVT family DNA-binding domain-containing protein [Candidatus Nanoarchaeia archaeon]|nr:AbrB/MazE/SpoVT family DNA-binding domain-containing protein [Candidatus Nanoarchaeia archaeon]